MEPVINVDEVIGKTVGRRKMGDPLELGFKLQEAGASFHDSIGLPRGVYKFYSHEEADAWAVRERIKRTKKEK